MLKKTILFILLITTIHNCNKALENASLIIDKSIKVSGGNLIRKSNISFNFRDAHYSANRDVNGFLLSRTTVKNTDTVVDFLSNLDFKREINGVSVAIADSMATKYAASVNSVHYFSVLPFGLEDKAVNKTYLGTVTIKGNSYYKIKVTFDEAGGGEDFEDVFIYWVNKLNFKVDYLAYSYMEDYDLGLRFREAYNERYIKGIRFVDYNNYKPKTKSASLENLDTLFERDSLELLSKIELKNVVVDLL